MSLKLVLLAFLIGAAFSPIRGDYDDESGCDGQSSDGDGYKWWEPSGDGGFRKNLKYLNGRLKSIGKKAEGLCGDLGSKEWSEVYNDSVDNTIQIAVVAGKLIDNVIPKLGSKFLDIVVAHIKTYVCVFQTEKLLNLHDGYIKPDVCTESDYGSEWGYRCHSTNYSSAADIIEDYNLDNASEQVERLLNKIACNNKKGVDALNENIRVIVKAILKISKIIDRFPKLQCSNEEDFTEALGEFLLVLAGMGNNIKPGYGVKFMNDYHSLYNYTFLEAGFYDISSTIPDATKRLSSCGYFSWEPTKNDKNNENQSDQSEHPSNKSDENGESEEIDAPSRNKADSSEQTETPSKNSDNNDETQETGDKVNNGDLENFKHLEQKMDSLTKAATKLNGVLGKEQRNKNYGEACDTVVQLGHAAGQMMDKTFPGLGTIYSNMLMAHVRVQVCLYSYKTDLLSKILGTKKPALCNVNYGESWGCPRYNGTFDSAAEIIKSHNLYNSHEQVTELISKYSKGKGVSGIDEQYREIIRALEDYSKHFDELYSCNSRDDKDFIAMLLDSLIMNGGLANHLQPNYGNKIVDSYLAFFSSNFHSYGYPNLAAAEAGAKKLIKKCGPVSWRGAANNKESNDDSSDSNSNKKQKTIMLY